MTQLTGFLSALPELLLVILGFGFIIFIHELGHFIAAKWAGIRVLAFAVGFGRPILCYRKGMGVRWGRSTEPEHLKRVASGRAEGLSPTEYRLNWMPLGGYVKMLGQEDLNPGATSGASDSFQNTAVWKRMVVISAGVVMNVILAAVLFVIVFMTGLKTEPPEIGGVLRGNPAATVMPVNALQAGVVDAGLMPGDVVVKVNGRAPAEFTDLAIAAAMSRRNAAVHLLVEREGVAEPLEFHIVPKEGDQKLLEIGIYPASTNQLRSMPEDHPSLPAVRRDLARIGLEGVEPGMTLVSIDGRPADEAADLMLAVRRSGGEPVTVEFAGDGGRRVVRELRPEAELELTTVTLPSGMTVPVQHVLGLTPVMRVSDLSEPAQGLQPGDIFARIGSAHYPSLPEGMAEIHAHKGQTVRITVLRAGPDGTLQPVELQPEVRPTGAGQIGFIPESTHKLDTLVALPPRGLEKGGSVAATDLVSRAGSRIVSIAGRPVADFREIRAALKDATAAVLQENAASATIPVVLEMPLAAGGGRRVTETVPWTLSRAEIQRVHALGWQSPIESLAFEPKQFLLQADGPFAAMRMGIDKTHRVMVMTYLTFARLFQGTVKVEHLKGPVGIAHMGTRVAERGLIWLLFFMALISVNLAVINFLPLPIVDGGQFIFLVLEQIRGKPVSVEIQNVATVIGLLLIGTMFIIVTFQDIANLFG